MKKIVTLFLLSAFLALPLIANAQVPSLNVSWEAPTTGSDAVKYIVEVSVNGGPFSIVGETTEISYNFDGMYLNTYIARVAGVDALGRQGEYSNESEPYTPDLGPPGKPGKPIVIESKK